MIQTLEDRLFAENGITADVLRLDLIHPEVSGNKWFKLKYHVAETFAQHKSGMLSFGGAFSNHLVALAFTCRENGLRATAIIRGDDPQMNNPSLQQMRDYGMELLFVTREEYKNKALLAAQYLSANPEYYCVPEGGQGALGIKGASEIMQPGFDKYTDIICAVGTGTTMAGIVRSSSSAQKITGVSALKVADKNNNQLIDFISENTKAGNFKILFDYHFGGYAKKNDELILFMNTFFRNENIPTDFVYTGKLFYALYDLAGRRFFDKGSRLLMVHSGGLQGNRSLPRGVLNF